ncbi:uncharacterized protein LOC117169917 [Belonocnema kinseyi]|uniref:uncharacterized protein LOC117169917 n=1 Tax=Belonocnema kinseyi TaxID=2817044 RepID=UPI00143CEA19|nr:uncharacterized protein LOC117169917 [Belonocnema kinseyi]
MTRKASPPQYIENTSKFVTLKDLSFSPKLHISSLSHYEGDFSESKDLKLWNYRLSCGSSFCEDNSRDDFELMIKENLIAKKLEYSEAELNNSGSDFPQTDYFQLRLNDERPHGFKPEPDELALVLTAISDSSVHWNLKWRNKKDELKDENTISVSTFKRGRCWL